jgi:hypothetical protein
MNRDGDFRERDTQFVHGSWQEEHLIAWGTQQLHVRLDQPGVTGHLHSDSLSEGVFKEAAFP